MAGHALVTGAASGIGKAIASRLLTLGWRVTGMDRTAIEPIADRFDSMAVDLGDTDHLRKVLADLRGVSAIVHAAGFMRTGLLGALNTADGLAMWRVHVESAIVIVDALVPKMQSGGRVVLIGSRTASGAAGRSQYAASKAALYGLARSWAAETAPKGITVNIVAPGATETPMLNDPAREGVAPRLPPLGRFIHPDEIAALTAFLLGPEAAAITGQQIVVCGGGSI
jgi:NAD(P)-dependent dehydrogenase (short-subunit alcohol dehydrogenase family)